MERIVWNDELAILAQNWINQCNFEHDDNINRNWNRDLTVGQNLGQFVNVEPEKVYKEVVKMWFDEYEYFPPSSISPYKRPQGDFQNTQSGGHKKIPKVYCKNFYFY